ncbi:MAG TPA: fused MFS/spermidine synthase [Jiangellales bacterium]|nr:fused MFS/spermidine synthase [Jiangellales bacterium]
MPAALASLVVVVAGAAVLVVETLAARLVAPYVGLTLEAFTAAIAAALLGIALGARLGGVAADRYAPLSVVTVGLAGGGVGVLAVRPVIHVLGPSLAGGGPFAALWLVGVATLPAVTLLSAVPPAVVAARLSRLDETGTVVGRLSALGTLGALAGSVLTGFVLVAALPTSSILAVTAGAVLLLAVITVVVVHRSPSAAARDERGSVGVVTVLVGAVAAGAGLALVDGPCEVETPYSCARVAADPERPSGRLLVLDDLNHSYVDLDDPTYLEFSYVRRFAGAVEGWWPSGEPLRAVHVGGGGFTLPRWLAATRPGSDSVVLEIDDEVVELVRRELGLRTGPALRVEVGDARTSLVDLPAGSADLVVGDAFGSLSVPWHLSTVEAAELVRAVLVEDGLYVLNVIDRGDLALLRAEVATLQAVFGDVAVAAAPGTLVPGSANQGGNYVLVASPSGLPADRLAAVADSVARRDAGADAVMVRPLSPLAGGMVLTDDHAPTDQLLTPYVGPRG